MIFLKLLLYNIKIITDVINNCFKWLSMNKVIGLI